MSWKPHSHVEKTPHETVTLCVRAQGTTGKVSPVAAVHVEEDDDKSKAVASQVGAAEKPGESSSAVLPPCNLMRYRETKGSVSQLSLYLIAPAGGWLQPIPAVRGPRQGYNEDKPLAGLDVKVRITAPPCRP